MTTTGVHWRRAVPSALWISLAALATGEGLALLWGGLGALPSVGGAVGAILWMVALRGLYLLLAVPYLVAACLGSLFEAAWSQHRWGRFWLNGVRYLGRAYRLAWRLLWIGLIALGCGAGWTLLLRGLHGAMGADGALAGDAVIAVMTGCYLSVVGPCTVVPGGTARTRATRVIVRRWSRVLAGLALWAAAAVWMVGLATVARGRGPWVGWAAGAAALFIFSLLYMWGLGLLPPRPGAPRPIPGRRCAACGAAAPSGAGFCPACGAALAASGMLRRPRALLALVVVACLVAAMPSTRPASAAGPPLTSGTPVFTPSQTCQIESSMTGGAYSLRACLANGASTAAFKRALLAAECRVWREQSATFEAQVKADEATGTDPSQRVTVDMLRLLAFTLNASCLLAGGSALPAGLVHTWRANFQGLLHALVRLETTPQIEPSGSFLNPIIPPVTLSLGPGSTPGALLYAASSGRLYVADPGTDRIWVLPSSLAAAEGSVSLPGAPMAMTRASQGHRLFVTYATPAGGDGVAAVATSHPHHPSVLWTESLPQEHGYAGVAYDPVNGNVYVVNGGACTVEAFAGGTGTASPAVSLPVEYGVPSCGDGIVYDPALNDLIITPPAGQSPDTLLQFDPSTAQVVRSVCLGTAFATVQAGQVQGTTCAGSLDAAASATGCASGPHAVYDAQTGDLYLASHGGSRLTVLQAGTLDVLGRWSDGGGVSAVATAASSGDVFTAVDHTGLTGLEDPLQLTGLWWFTTQTPPRDGSAAVGTAASVFCGIATNAATGEVYLADAGTGTVDEVPRTDLTPLGTTQAASAAAPGEGIYAAYVGGIGFCDVAAPWVAGAVLPVTGPVGAGADVVEALVDDPLATAIVDPASKLYGLYGKVHKSLKALSGASGTCGAVVKTG